MTHQITVYTTSTSFHFAGATRVKVEDGKLSFKYPAENGTTQRPVFALSAIAGYAIGDGEKSEEDAPAAAPEQAQA